MRKKNPSAHDSTSEYFDERNHLFVDSAERHSHWQRYRRKQFFRNASLGRFLGGNYDIDENEYAQLILDDNNSLRCNDAIRYTNTSIAREKLNYHNFEGTFERFIMKTNDSVMNVDKHRDNLINNSPKRQSNEQDAPSCCTDGNKVTHRMAMRWKVWNCCLSTEIRDTHMKTMKINEDC